MRIVDEEYIKELENKEETNIVDLPVITSLSLDPDKILQKSMGNLETAIVIGYDKDGYEYFASSIGSGPEIVWLIERFKKALLEVMDNE